MRSPYDPLPEDLRAWAYTHGAIEPVQDWDLMITDAVRAPRFIEFAGDPKCPNGLFFLKCLYLLVGDAVRTQGLSCDLEVIRKLLASQQYNRNPDIQAWVQRSQKLIQSPERFQYDDWCGGRLALDPEMKF